MDKNNFLGKMKRGVVKRSPELLACGAILGILSTTVLAVKATPKAMRLLEEAEAKKGEKLTPIEMVQTAWKEYIPAAISGTVSALCITGINSIHAKRNAALMTAYQISTKAYSDYRAATIDAVGKKKEEEIRGVVHQKQIEEKPISNSTVFITGKGCTKVFDAYSGRYIESDIDTIRNAVFDLNEKMQKGMEMNISLNEFYVEIGAPQVTIGDRLGWTPSNYIDVAFDAKLDDKKEPCVVFEFLVPPEYGYRDVYF